MNYQDRLEAAVEALRRAIEDADADPKTHGARMARHREQWPELWTAIDQLVQRP